MTDDRAFADALITAEHDRSPIPPLTQTYPFLTVDAAYRVQSLVVAHRVNAGETVVGAKLGLTSAVKRHALGIHAPMFGRLTSGMLLPFGEPLPLDQLIAPRAEPELAFLIGSAIGASTTVAGVLAATEAIFPAIEAVDTRYSQRFTLADSIADNGGAARVVLGTRPRKPSDLEDLRVLGCLFRSGERVHTAAGGAVMGHPAAAVVWLANALAARGECLDAGTIVLSGGLTASVPLRRGAIVLAEFDGLGTVDLRCHGRHD